MVDEKRINPALRDPIEDAMALRDYWRDRAGLFKVPEPYEMEPQTQYITRVVAALEEWVNTRLAPLMPVYIKDQGNG